MPHGSSDFLVEERVAQLEQISQRRNELLRQMYDMIRRRQRVGSVLVEDEDEDNLHMFLKRFDLHVDDMQSGSIINLGENEILDPPAREVTPSRESPSRGEDNQVPHRTTRARYRTPQPRKPSLSSTSDDIDMEVLDKMPTGSRDSASTSQQTADNLDDEHDELDLLGAPPFVNRLPVFLTPSRNSSVAGSEVASPTTPGDHVPPGPSDGKGGKEIPEDERILSEGPLGGTNFEDDARQPKSSPADDMVLDLHTDEATAQSFPSQEHPEEPTETMKSNDMDDERQFKGMNDSSPPRGEELVPGVQVTQEQISKGQPPVDIELTIGPHQLDLSPIPLTLGSLASLPKSVMIVVSPSTPRIAPELNVDFIGDAPPPSAELTPPSPSQPRHQIQVNYTLPLLKHLPSEYNRKTRSTKRKREKERERNEGRKEKDPNKDDWVPMGLNRWVATVAANPVWKRVSRASKCLNTRDWSVAMTEMRLIRTVERVEGLKREGRWGFRQIKKQRGVGGLTKTHRDHLLDEMKWMRIDFREERKWKMALAYDLSTAVLEWHSASSYAERFEKGICVRWKPPLPQNDDAMVEDYIDEGQNDLASTNVNVSQPDENPKSSLLGVDYNSDDDEEEYEGGKDSRNVINPLEPAAMIEDTLDAVAQENSIHPKTEDFDDTSILADNGNDAVQPPSTKSSMEILVEEEKFVNAGLKLTSNDPILGLKPTPTSSTGEIEPSPPTAKSLSRSFAYAPLREQVAYSDDMKLFLSPEDLTLVKLESFNYGFADSVHNLDLTAIFPDLQPLGLLESPSVVLPSAPEGKRRSEKRSDRDDPTKRSEETTYTKLFPAGKFMFSKPTLLGPLQPSKHWRDNRWTAFEDGAGNHDTDSMKVQDELNELFDSRSSNSPTSMMLMQMQVALLKEKDPRKRGADHLWSYNDDALLKSYIDKYPNNWALISECFNASRLTITTDRRTPRDCLERWKEKWGLDGRQKPSDPPTTTEEAAPPSASQMTTRGVKRMTSGSTSGLAQIGAAAGSEPRKRRRHLLVQETIRKAGKKRAELAQKALANQRKPPAIHETHAQYSKMTKFTPAELSRKKAEKEAKDIQDLQLARRRQEELNRQNSMLQQANRMNVPQQVIQQQLLNAAQRANGTGVVQSQGVPQIRSQVNISQQQRIGTPSMPIGNPRLSPQQLMQVQAQQARAAQQQTQQPQPQGQAQSVNLISSANSSHLSPYVNRETAASPTHVPPPGHVPATPSNVVNSPRPPSAQAHNLQVGQVPGNASTRPTPNGYYVASLPNIPGYTQEQLHAALRLQHLQPPAGPTQVPSSNFSQQP